MLKDLTTQRPFVSDSIQGIKRTENQDDISIIKRDDYTLFVVFDGVGSASNSKYAVLSAVEFLGKHSDKFNNSDDYNIRALIVALNEHLLSSNKSEPLTTYCLLCIDDRIPNYRISNLGDSRVYNFNRQHMTQVSTDDGLPGTNIITNCLGLRKLTENEIRVTELKEITNSILLCTDGFYNIMEKDLIKFFNILNDKQTLRIPDKLKIEITHKNNDDASYIIIK